MRWGTRAVFGRRVSGSSGNRCVTRQPTHWLLDARLRGHDSLWQWAARHCEVIDYWMPDCAGMTAWGGRTPRHRSSIATRHRVMGHGRPPARARGSERILRGSLREHLRMTTCLASGQSADVQAGAVVDGRDKSGHDDAERLARGEALAELLEAGDALLARFLAAGKLLMRGLGKRDEILIGEDALVGQKVEKVRSARSRWRRRIPDRPSFEPSLELPYVVENQGRGQTRRQRFPTSCRARMTER